jgi:hypothetical protein
MWPEVVKRLPRFSSAVLTGLDASGDPVSLRCQPTLDHQAQVLRLMVPDGLGMVPGPAGLLCHRHDEQLWGLKSFLLRGGLERTGHGWVFRPHQLVHGMDTTAISNLRACCATAGALPSATLPPAACRARRSHGSTTQSSRTRRAAGPELR